VAAGFAIAHGFSFLVGMYCIYRATHVGIVVAEPIQLGAGD
jgi:hypothetical protein